jgi:heat shock protein HslJ
MFLLFSFFACFDTGNDSGDAGFDFVGMDFVLESSEGYELVSEGAWMSFPAENELSFSADCNSLGGTYSVDDDVFTLSEAYMTEMACDTDLMNEDSWFISFFEASPTLHFDGERLTFTGAEASLVFVDSEIVSPDQVFVGPTWIIDTFIDGDSASAYNLLEASIFAFDSDGNVAIFGGCNSGGGTYTLDAGTLSFSDLSSTYMACDEDIMAAEAHLFSVLEESGLSTEIDGNRLTIMGSSLGISGFTE